MVLSFWPRLTPSWLSQSINRQLFQGAHFGFFNIELGQTQHPEIEQDILDEVGSYGRQLGRIGDAIEVLAKHIDRRKLSQEERDALTILEAQLAQIRAVKRRTLRHD